MEGGGRSWNLHPNALNGSIWEPQQLRADGVELLLSSSSAADEPLLSSVCFQLQGCRIAAPGAAPGAEGPLPPGRRQRSTAGGWGGEAAPGRVKILTVGQFNSL